MTLSLPLVWTDNGHLSPGPAGSLLWVGAESDPWNDSVTSKSSRRVSPTGESCPSHCTPAYLIPNLAKAANFVAAVAEVAEADSRHLDMRLGHGVVDLSLCTHADGLWVTQKDIDLARKISSSPKRTA